MNLLDIYKAKKLGIGTKALLASYVGRKDKYGVVDLGTLTWASVSTKTSGKSRFRCEIPGIKRPSGNNVVANIRCKEYTVSDWNATFNCDDKTIGVSASYDRVAIYDESLAQSTTSEVKAAMKGVYLLYEKAE